MIKALDHLVLTVNDLQKTLEFYQKALLMKPEEFGDGRVALKFSDQKINLHLSGQEFEPKAKIPTPGSADLCFLTDWPLSEIKAHLLDLSVPIEIDEVQRTGATGKILSIYIRDPDQNLIEISNLIK